MPSVGFPLKYWRLWLVCLQNKKNCCHIKRDSLQRAGGRQFANSCRHVPVPISKQHDLRWRRFGHEMKFRAFLSKQNYSENYFKITICFRFLWQDRITERLITGKPESGNIESGKRQVRKYWFRKVRETPCQGKQSPRKLSIESPGKSGKIRENPVRRTPEIPCTEWLGRERCQFHQHFTPPYSKKKKCFAHLPFLLLQFSFVIFWKKNIGGKAACKCWWNWLNMLDGCFEENLLR